MILWMPGWPGSARRALRRWPPHSPARAAPTIVDQLDQARGVERGQLRGLITTALPARSAGMILLPPRHQRASSRRDRSTAERPAVQLDARAVLDHLDRQLERGGGRASRNRRRPPCARARRRLTLLADDDLGETRARSVRCARRSLRAGRGVPPELCCHCSNARAASPPLSRRAARGAFGHSAKTSPARVDDRQGAAVASLRPPMTRRASCSWIGSLAGVGRRGDGLAGRLRGLPAPDGKTNERFAVKPAFSRFIRNCAQL